MQSELEIRILAISSGRVESAKQEALTVCELHRYLSRYITNGCNAYYLDCSDIKDIDDFSGLLQVFAEINAVIPSKLKLYIRMGQLIYGSKAFCALARKAGCQMIIVELESDHVSDERALVSAKKFIHFWHGAGILCFCTIILRNVNAQDFSNSLIGIRRILNYVPIDFVNLYSSNIELCLDNNLWARKFYNFDVMVLLYKRAVAVQINPSKITRVVSSILTYDNCFQSSLGLNAKYEFISRDLAGRKGLNLFVGRKFSRLFFWIMLAITSLAIKNSRKSKCYVDSALLP